MTGRLALMLSMAALLILCGCSSYEVTSSGDPAPLPAANGLSLNVEVAFGPNNTEPETTIRIEIPAPGPVRLEILNATGHRVRLLLDEVLAAPFLAVSWDARNDDGREVESGIYIYRLQAAGAIIDHVAVFCLTKEDCEELTNED
jgi:ABC-type transport system substrate-binding protein